MFVLQKSTWIVSKTEMKQRKVSTSEISSQISLLTQTEVFTSGVQKYVNVKFG